MLGVVLKTKFRVRKDLSSSRNKGGRKGERDVSMKGKADQYHQVLEGRLPSSLRSQGEAVTFTLSASASRLLSLRRSDTGDIEVATHQQSHQRPLLTPSA